jgi:hypothetical protein
MIGIKNVVVASGYSYQKYLKNELLKVQENIERQKAYNSGDMILDMDGQASIEELAWKQMEIEKNLKRYTRCGGTLFDEYGLSGHLTDEKIDQISALELGTDDRTKDHVKLTPKNVKTVMGPDGLEIEVTKKDIKRGFAVMADGEKFEFDRKEVKETSSLRRKAGIEFLFTQDATVSYAIAGMNELDKLDAETMLMDTAAEIYETVIKQYLNDYKGVSGDTGYYSYYHNDNRTGAPFSHCHFIVSNLVKLPNGDIHAIEIPEMRQKGFHAMIDAQYKAALYTKWNERFVDHQVEAYDKDGQKLTSGPIGEIHDWRIAFDDASLAKIANNSKAKELIDRKISEEKVDLFNKVETKRMGLERELTKLSDPDNLPIDPDAAKDQVAELTERIERLNKSYEQQLKALESTKHRNDIWTGIKQPKKNASKQYKDLELAKGVAELDLKMKTGDDIGKAFKPKSDEQILETITATSPFFTRNALVTEIAKSRGAGSEAQKMADDLMEKLTADRAIVMCGSGSNKQEQFTTFDLIEQERQNVDMMRQQFLSRNDKLVPNVDGAIEKIQARTGITPEIEQKDFIRAVFNEKNGQIVVGVPGGGKSLCAGWATEIANANGYRTIGLAPTGKVATALANETLVNFACTIDKLNLDIASGKVELGSNDIIFLDEASMVGTRNWNKLLKNLNGAKIVAVGDPNQIQAVSSGNTLKEFMKDDVIAPNVNYLVKIRRQKDAVAKLIAGHTSLKDDYKSGDIDAIKRSGTHITASIAVMAEHGKIHKDYITTTEKIDDVANRYLANANVFSEKLLLCSTNKTVDRLNNVIQDKRLSNNEIGGEFFENNKNRFYAGDRIVMEKNNKDEYNNGDFGVITSVIGNKITIEFDNKKVKTLTNPKNMNLGYGLTFEKSQGMTVNDTLVVGENSQNNNQELINVGLTRNRYNVELFTTQSEYQDVIASYKRESNKASLIDLYNTYFKPTVAPAPTIQDDLAKQVEQTKMATSALKTLEPSELKGMKMFNDLMTKLKAKGIRIEVPEFIKTKLDYFKAPPNSIRNRQAPMLSSQIPNTDQIRNVAVLEPKLPPVVVKPEIAVKKNRGLEL